MRSSSESRRRREMKEKKSTKEHALHYRKEVIILLDHMHHGLGKKNKRKNIISMWIKHPTHSFAIVFFYFFVSFKLSVSSFAFYYAAFARFLLLVFKWMCVCFFTLWTQEMQRKRHCRWLFHSRSFQYADLTILIEMNHEDCLHRWNQHIFRNHTTTSYRSVACRIQESQKI